MKRLLLVLSLLAAGAGASAQNDPYLMVLGAQETAEGIRVAQPRSTLCVDMTVVRERVLSGPYARYALKYLGIRVPFTDKTAYSIDDAHIGLLEGDAWLVAQPLPPVETVTIRYDGAAEDFASVLPDRTDLAQLPLEDAARQTAEAIFSLRKHRIELITGEAGENVFGGGLQAALDAIARTEQSYLELFMGRRTVDRRSVRYVVHPRGDKRQYIVCRFGEGSGLLPENDLSGEIVLLQIEPGEPAPLKEASPKETNIVEVRLAAPSLCTLTSQGRELARATLPLFEFGRTVEVPLPRRK